MHSCPVGCSFPKQTSFLALLHSAPCSCSMMHAFGPGHLYALVPLHTFVYMHTLLFRIVGRNFSRFFDITNCCESSSHTEGDFPRGPTLSCPADAARCKEPCNGIYRHQRSFPILSSPYPRVTCSEMCQAPQCTEYLCLHENQPQSSLQRSARQIQIDSFCR